MFNFKSAFVLGIFMMLSTNASADEQITVDTSDLQASINAELTAAMAVLHQEALQTPTLLIADGILATKQTVESK